MVDSVSPILTRQQELVLYVAGIIDKLVDAGLMSGPSLLPARGVTAFDELRKRKLTLQEPAVKDVLHHLLGFSRDGECIDLVCLLVLDWHKGD